MDDWTARNEEENRNPKHSNNCNGVGVCKGWLNDKPCSYISKNTSPDTDDTGKHTDRHGVWSGCPEHEVGSCCPNFLACLLDFVDFSSMLPGNVEVIHGLDSVKQSALTLPTPEQQELYEWMHHALNLRIR